MIFPPNRSHFGGSCARNRNCNDGPAGSLSAKSEAEARRGRAGEPDLQQPLADGAVLSRPRRQPRGVAAQIPHGAVGVHRPRAGSRESDIILGVLSLIDISLTGNLILIVVFSGYENFVSKIDPGGHPDWPDWMTKLNFGG